MRLAVDERASIPPSWAAVWLAAIARPTVASYRAVGDRVSARRGAGVAGLWVFSSALLTGTLVSLVPRGARLSASPDLALAVAIVSFAALAAVLWAGYTACVHGCGRLLRGRGRHRALLCVSAAFHAPLMLLAGVVALVAHSRIASGVLYLYWLVLYVLAVRASYELPWVRAALAALMPVMLAAGVLLAAGLYAAWPNL